MKRAEKEECNLSGSAAAAFINLIESGTYQKLKQQETFLDQSKEALRGMLYHYEGKRHEFKEINYVAKFVRKNVWQTNHAGLIEELLCYVQPNIAAKAIQLDVKKIKEANEEGCNVHHLLTPYQNPDTYYLRPTLNKHGKRQIRTHDYLFGGQSIEELVTEIRDNTVTFKAYAEEYEHFKKAAEQCPVLKEKYKVTTPYGSVSLLSNRPTWNIENILNEMGEELIVSYGKVDISKLEQLILQGLIPKSMVSPFRKLLDIRLDFVVMDMSSEEKAVNFHRNKQIQASLKRFA
ncbi:MULTISPECIES: hypothetical protein [Bacillus]|uniref:hypothetical protein n=1 Tax=Bacillus TaxID=1386 RepID=UPI00273F3F04|nr:hypothetical protein [Bacillus sp. MMSF_3328]